MIVKNNFDNRIINTVSQTNPSYRIQDTHLRSLEKESKTALRITDSQSSERVRIETDFYSRLAERLRDEELEEADDLQLAIECDRELSEQHIEEK
jgi:capsule polysaccharide export protein KpsC/LpsZ